MKAYFNKLIFVLSWIEGGGQSVLMSVGENIREIMVLLISDSDMNNNNNNKWMCIVWMRAEVIGPLTVKLLIPEPNVEHHSETIMQSMFYPQLKQRTTFSLVFFFFFFQILIHFFTPYKYN